MSTRVTKPPHTKTNDGESRRVGVEIELAGIDIPEISQMVAEIIGGKIVPANPHRNRITGSEHGDYVVELDAQILHPDDDAPASPESIENRARSLLGETVAGLVPAEIITPPLPWVELSIADDLIAALREKGAKGTADNPLYGFGLHLNPEIPSTDTGEIVRQLRAYILSAAWLRDTIQVNTTRRLLPHTDPFPREYALKVADPGYAPDQTQLINDYLDANPTRNRELDMLPLFKHLDEQTVVSRLDNALINARPTYHYRLPDCNISQPGWNVSTEWDRWVRIEELAADDDILREKAGRFIELEGRPTHERWLDELKEWFGG